MAQYMNSIKSLLEKYKSHVTEAVKTEATSCRPVWNIYRIGRDLVCRQALDSLVNYYISILFLTISDYKRLFTCPFNFRMDFGLYVFLLPCRLL
jgi:hypothetical protein